MRLLFVFFALGPGICSFSLAYLLRHPEDWIAPSGVLIAGLFVTFLTQTLGVKWLERILSPRYKLEFVLARISGLAMGVAVGLLAYFMLLSTA